MSYHHVTTKYVDSDCGTSGHKDIIAECTCGWKVKTIHGDQESLNSLILGHRLKVIEKELKIKFERSHVL